VECGGNVDFASEAEQDARATARNIHRNALRRNFMFFLVFMITLIFQQFNC
jgi:hypothetical protein